MDKLKTEELSRFGKFLAVGVLNTLVDFGLMNLFTQGFKWPLLPAQALSFILAVLNSFLFNRLWVYPETRGTESKFQLLKFVIVNLVGLAVRSLLVAFLDRWLLNLIHSTAILNSLNISPTILSHNAALAIAVPFTLVLNFLANRFWTFRSALKQAAGN